MSGNRSLNRPNSGQSVSEAYAKMVSDGVLQEDAAQRELVGLLDRLLVDLSEKRLASKSSALGWLFGKSSPAKSPRGLYIWGSVGRGKSLLMDLFFDRAPFERRRRAHFNDFMSDIHDRIHVYREKSKASGGSSHDPIPDIAEELSQDIRLLCFDEFTVTDIADAMILGRLFTELFAHGVTIVATSNVEPENLYKDGLNRSVFLPFIAVLQKNVDVFRLDARTDYRLEKLSQAPVYLTPNNSKAKAAMEEAWQRMTNGQNALPVNLSVKGRTLEVPQAVQGVARFSFAQLCEEPKGAADYLAVAREFHTVFIDDLRAIKEAERNVAKRFILMIDTFYDNQIKLVVTADVSPNALYHASWGTEAFEFERTVSRLIEMQSLDYLGSTGTLVS